MKNFHLPLPDQVFDELKLEAERRGLPATAMARQAIQTWLAARKKSSRKQAIAVYAAEMAGTEFDLDPALERATLELLLESDSQ